MQIEKSGPLPSEATYDALLTSVATAYWQSDENFNTTTIFPDLPVNLPGGKYKVYERGAFYRDEVGPRPRGGTFPKTGFSMSELPYSVEEEGLSTPIDERDTASAPDGGTMIERGKVQLLTQQHRISMANDWAAAYFRAGVWSYDRTGVAAAPGAAEFLQFDQAGADPVRFVRKERVAFHLRTGGMSANGMVVGMDLHRIFCDHDEIRGRIPNTQLSVATMQLLAQLFEVDFYVVAAAVWNDSKEGAAENMKFIANSRSMLLLHRTTTPGDPHAPTAGRTITWNGLVPGGGKMFGVNRWRENPYSENLDVRRALAMHRVATDLGAFYADAISADA